MIKNNLPVMILAGGFGTRLREETEFKPKPMVQVGGKPILWHIMKLYSYYGFYRFIICLGYKADTIKDYFLNYRMQHVDFTINTKTGSVAEHKINQEEWEVTLVDTGLDCFTGGRVARAAKYVDTDKFLLTYGDGLSDVNISKLLQYHESHGKLVTLTGIEIPSRFGNLEINDDQVTNFAEKTKSSGAWINGGFFIMDRKFLKYLSIDSRCVLEQEPLKNVALDKQLMIYKHRGFWQCMDTLREHELLERLWQNGAPWKVWQDEKLDFRGAIKDKNFQAGL